MYRYLDKHFHPPHRRKISIDLARLAYQHIGVSPGIELDKVRKRYIAPAAEELESVGYLEPMTTDQRFHKICRGQWTVAFVYNTKPPTSEIIDARSSRITGRLQSLLRRGISLSLAIQVVERVDDEVLVRAMRAMDEQRQRGISIRSPDMWLTKL